MSISDLALIEIVADENGVSRDTNTISEKPTDRPLMEFNERIGDLQLC